MRFAGLTKSVDMQAITRSWRRQRRAQSRPAVDKAAPHSRSCRKPQTEVHLTCRGSGAALDLQMATRSTDQ